MEIQFSLFIISVNKARDQLTLVTSAEIANLPQKSNNLEGVGVSIDFKPDAKYVTISEWWEKERKNGIESQIKLKEREKNNNKILQSEEQKQFREYWDKVNHDCDIIEIKNKAIKHQTAIEEQKLINDK